MTGCNQCAGVVISAVQESVNLAANLCYTSNMMSNAERKKVAERNLIRAEAKLPLLDGDRELERLRAARRERTFEAIFALEQARFSRNWTSKKSWFSGMAEYNRARHEVRLEVRTGKHMDVVLPHLGYKLVEESWTVEGRKTYVSDEDTDRAFLTDLERTLAEYGWDKHETRLRCFSNPHTGELIEIEPGGTDTSGHFLHHLKSEWCE
jgi:hypothetical protein